MGNAFQITTTRELSSIHDFTTEYTDEIFDNPGLPEAGRYAYNLHSYIRAKIKMRKIELVSALPVDHDIQIQGMQTGYSRELQEFLYRQCWRRREWRVVVAFALGGLPK